MTYTESNDHDQAEHNISCDGPKHSSWYGALGVSRFLSHVNNTFES